MVALMRAKSIVSLKQEQYLLHKHFPIHKLVKGIANSGRQTNITTGNPLTTRLPNARKSETHITKQITTSLRAHTIIEA